MDLFTYLLGKNGKNAQKDLFSYLLGKNAGGSGTYTTFSGTSLNISNTLQAKIKNIALEGNTNQETTTGKNLFDKDNQVKVQVNAGGTLRYGIIVDAPNKKVSISAKSWNNSIAVKQLINGTYGDFLNINSNTTFDVTDKLIIYSTSDTAKLDSNIEDLQIEISNAPTNYEPYTGGQPSPSPNYPQPIKVVTGEQNITIQSKNLFDKSKVSTYTFRTTATINNDKSVTITATGSNPHYCIISPYVFLEANTTYRISYDVDNMSGFDHMQMFVSSSTTAGGYSNTNRLTYTPDVSRNVAIGVYLKNNATITISNIQIEKGNTTTSYVPYQSQTYPLSLGNIELAKIGNYKDYIFKNVTDSPYYNADLDLNGWYLYKIIDKITLSNSDSFILDSYSLRFTKVLDTIYEQEGYSNRYIYGGTYQTTGKFEILGNGRLAFSYPDSNIDTVAELQTYLTANELYMYLPLATPTNTKITDTTLISQLENINNNAHSYKDTTYIICSSESTDNEVIGFSGDIKVTSVGLGNSLNTSLLSSNLQEETNIDDIQEEPNLDDVNEIEEQNDEPIENEEIEEPIEKEVS